MAFWKADDDTQINFEMYGDATGGETLLLLPGLLGSVSSQWRNFVQPLSEGYRVILVDLRGHGRSENKEAGLRPERMVEDLIGLLDYSEADPVHVAGYSLGGYLGLMLHLRQPRRVPTLLMHATKFYWTQQAAAQMRQQLDPDVLGSRAPGYANQLAQEHGGSHWRVLVRQAADLVASLVDGGITEGMAGRVQCPVLVSVGDRDEMVPLPEALRLSRALPQGELLVLPGVRHPFATVRTIPLLPTMQAFHQAEERRAW